MKPPLSFTDLYQGLDIASLPFETTRDVDADQTVIGQARALGAIDFAMGIDKDGYNLFAMGPAGSGKQRAVMERIKALAAKRPSPDDICYVNNFKHPHYPTILTLPSGEGERFQQAVHEFVEDLLNVYPGAFESREHRDKKEALAQVYKTREDEALGAIRDKAKGHHLGFVRSNEGFGFAPLNDQYEPFSPDQYQELDESVHKAFEEAIEAMQKELKEAFRTFTQWKKELKNALKELDTELAEDIASHLMEPLQKSYRGIDGVPDYLDALLEDITRNVHTFLDHDSAAAPGLFAPPKSQNPLVNPPFTKYRVNLLSLHRDKSAPIIYEDNPTFQNLVGYIEHTAHFGMLSTDFSLIKPGAFHKANGGYLILDARKLLMQPYAWEAFKRVLRSKQVRIESIEQTLSLTRTTSLEPQPMPLDVKVVLLGERDIYYALFRLDPDFQELFKVMADFDETMGRDEASTLQYIRMLASVIERQNLRHLERSGMAALIDYSTRYAGNRTKLSTHIGKMTDVLEEADFLAGKSGRTFINGEDIRTAIINRRYRNGRVKERLMESILEGTFVIDTEGEAVGQINALAVVSLGDEPFGRPSRVTAKTRLGGGKIVNIEREVSLSGASHSKGVLILSSLLGSRYAKEAPLSLSASLVFEQSYGGIDGDSASAAEFFALISSLADLPIDQAYAVTGSINQHGDIQAIGGVNEKIEGFFDLCCSRGFAKNQGVIIPQSNVKHLMLRHDVLEAVKNGEFSVYAIETVDEGMELLMGKKAGKRIRSGRFEKNSINYLVEEKLLHYAKLAQTRPHARKKETRP